MKIDEAFNHELLEAAQFNAKEAASKCIGLARKLSMREEEIMHYRKCLTILSERVRDLELKDLILSTLENPHG